MSSITLRELQLAELNILKQVIKICDDNNITYYALGGTLLGAVRHKGFIPWDDDIDIGIPRPDYERFLQIAEAELKAPLSIVTLANGRGEYAYYYPRIINKDIRLIRRQSEKEVVINAWIDIFPLDGAPAEQNEVNSWFERIAKAKWLFQFSQFEYFFHVSSPDSEKANRFRALKTALKRIIYKVKLYKLINTKSAWRKLDKQVTKYGYDKSERLANTCGFWGVKECFPKSVYGKGQLYQFEDIMLNGPENYDFVLTQMYGDYMTPPPATDREHHFVEIL